MDDSRTGITRLHVIHENFLNCVINIYGPTNSGKTAITRDIMFNLKDKIPMGFVFNPTNPVQKAYDYYFPDLAIITITEVTKLETKISAIYKRQEMVTEMYRCANNVNILHKIYLRLRTPASDSILIKLEVAEQRYSKALVNLKRAADQEARSGQQTRPKTAFYQKEKDRIEDMLLRARIMFYKSIIRPKRDDLLKHASHTLADEEKYAINYLDINPNVLLIFDDVVDELKPIQKTLIQTIVHKCRHVYMTIIFLMQDDAMMIRDIRKQPRYSIFMKATAARTYAQRKENNMDKNDVKKIDEICDKVWRPTTPHRKLVYCNQAAENQFRYIDFTYHTEKFQFGSPAFRDFCDKAKSNGTHIDKTNPFFNVFKVQ